MGTNVLSSSRAGVTSVVSMQTVGGTFMVAGAGAVTTISAPIAARVMVMA